jgi:hypothetical protein
MVVSLVDGRWSWPGSCLLCVWMVRAFRLSLRLCGFASRPRVSLLVRGIATRVVSRNRRGLFRSLFWGRSLREVYKHCDSRSGPTPTSSTSKPRLRCSKHVLIDVVLFVGWLLYLAFEKHRSRTDQIAFVIRLLHRRCRFVAHHVGMPK